MRSSKRVFRFLSVVIAMTAGMVILRKLFFGDFSGETVFVAFASALVLELLMGASSKKREQKNG